MEKWIQKLLKSIEDANKKNFGDGKMDCCDLSQKEKLKAKGKNRMGEVR